MSKQLVTYKQFREVEKLLEKMLLEYSNIEYQKITNDISFDNVPEKLRELWYQPDSNTNLSLFNAKDRLTTIAYASDVEEVISDFKDLEEELASQFNEL